MTRLSRSYEGFTLVELVLIILLLGIISLVTVPKFFNLTDFSERGYFDDTVSAFRYAQKLAVVSGCDVRIGTSAAGYRLDKRQSCDTTSAFSRSVRFPGKDVDLVPPPAGIAVSNATVIYGPLGTAMDASRVVSNATVTIGSLAFNIVGQTGFVDTP